jgi:hypothetical protein
VVGLIAVAIACVTSGFSGVYFEMVKWKGGSCQFAESSQRYSNRQTRRYG